MLLRHLIMLVASLALPSCALVNAIEEPPNAIPDAGTNEAAVDGGAIDAGPAADAGDNAAADGGSSDAGPTPVNHKPVVASVTITPENPTKATALSAAAATPIDADGDVVTLRYVWKVNDTAVDGQTGSSLATNFFNKGQVVTVTVTPNDAKDDGAPVSADATIGNSAPTAPFATITASPRDADDITCSIAIASADLDGADTVAYLFSWTKNGQPFSGSSTQATSSTVPNALTASGDVFACSVAATDGMATTTGSSATTAVYDQVCGDGLVQGTEACDDGNDNDADGCTTACATSHVMVATTFDPAITLRFCAGCSGLGCPYITSGWLNGAGDWNTVCFPAVPAAATKVFIDTVYDPGALMFGFRYANFGFHATPSGPVISGPHRYRATIDITGAPKVTVRVDTNQPTQLTGTDPTYNMRCEIGWGANAFQTSTGRFDTLYIAYQ